MTLIEWVWYQWVKWKCPIHPTYTYWDDPTDWDVTSPGPTGKPLTTTVLKNPAENDRLMEMNLRVKHHRITIFVTIVGAIAVAYIGK